MSGERFGRLVVIQSAERDKWRNLLWECQCDCGGFTLVTMHNLRSGNTRSCGCLKREALARSTLHGEGDKPTVEYKTWEAMIRRCESPKAVNFKDYGGRGIKVCAEWRADYRRFLVDMGRRPSQRHSIDRIENDGNYEPGNCRWATRSEQNSNKRRGNREAFN
jgi:hypothetical protein